MATFHLRTAMPVPAAELAAWHARPAAFQRLQPPWEDVRIERVDGPFADGQRVEMLTQLAPGLSKRWVAELYDVVPGRQFRDRQLHGPFRHWDHTHTFEPAADGTSVLEDHVEYAAPLGRLGEAVGGVRWRLAAMFAYRHALTASDLRRHAQYRDRPRRTVAVTGSNGLIGSELCHFLTTGGHAVVRLVRGELTKPAFDDGTTQRHWNPEVADPAVLEGVDAVVHLAGESLADGRWSAAKKRAIRESRVGPTRTLAQAVTAAGVPVFVSASAVGIYGDRGDEELTAFARTDDSFLSQVCIEWEAAAEPAAAAGARVAHPRFGVVLSPKGGALAKQLPAWKAGGGAVVGDGRQWVPWVGINDAVGAVHHLLMEEVRGAVNVVAPHPVTNREFGRTLAAVLGRPFLLTLPRPAVRLMFGEMGEAVLLTSTRAVPKRLLDGGFGFDHPTLEAALRSVLGRGGG